ncbi:molybdopterin converting factor subunit 1 [Azospira restricta]|uniref:Molybdopterin synthase sulfur carrier subunit n=1 Tax=Azospira restricta TaxID=404405 RepID=A0A974PXT4_9RHOO|nr:molybdopterin converting factor subunit 1 [Azospira restricta]QRJ62960.1 molybdopterin converting factor subunit 1 [Azospira restricta]
MVKILYFASLREKLGTSGESLELPAGVADVGGLLAALAARGGEWESLAAVRNLKSAVNQEMARSHTPVKDGDEVAFFPPVTGG